ncbi:hypothetical protein ACFPRL_11695 [Pseudoclavibacter helvolus]
MGLVAWLDLHRGASSLTSGSRCYARPPTFTRGERSLCSFRVRIRGLSDRWAPRAAELRGVRPDSRAQASRSRIRARGVGGPEATVQRPSTGRPRCAR